MSKTVDALPEVEFVTEPTFDADGVQATSGIGKDGLEYPDPVPVSPPVGFIPPPDLMTMIRRMVQSEQAERVLEAQGLETFEEADDFDIEDDPLDPLTPYEAVFLPSDSEKAPKAVPQVSTAPPAPAPVVAPPPNSGPTEAGVSSPPPGSQPPQPVRST